MKNYLKAKKKWQILVFVISYVKHQFQFEAKKCMYRIKFPFFMEKVCSLQTFHLNSFKIKWFVHP